MPKKQRPFCNEHCGRVFAFSEEGREDAPPYGVGERKVELWCFFIEDKYKNKGGIPQGIGLGAWITARGIC